MKKLAIGIAPLLATVSLHASCVDQDVALPVLTGAEGMRVPRPGTDDDMDPAAGSGGMQGMAGAGGAAGMAGTGGMAGSGMMAGSGGMQAADSGAPAQDASTADAAVPDAGL